MLGNAYETAEDRLGNGQPKICALGCDLGLRASYTANPNDRERSTFHAKRYRPHTQDMKLTEHADVPKLSFVNSGTVHPCRVEISRSLADTLTSYALLYWPPTTH